MQGFNILKWHLYVKIRIFLSTLSVAQVFFLLRRRPFIVDKLFKSIISSFQMEYEASQLFKTNYAG